MVLYEHPLNEHIRNYLKLEQLFSQVYYCANNDISVNYPVFFNAFFAIIDMLERNDIRGDLIKDLEKLEQNLVLWSKAPDIDASALEDNLREAVRLTARLKINSPRWWQLKEDKLLSGLKQRFSIQGGNSIFDLPQLQFWLHQPSDVIAKDIQEWFSLLGDVKSALILILRFIRQRGEFQEINTDSGFYQDNGEGLSLLRIKVAKPAQYYPSVSGNKFRYSIRFMLPCEQNGRRYSNQATQFQLSRC